MIDLEVIPAFPNYAFHRETQTVYSLKTLQSMKPYLKNARKKKGFYVRLRKDGKQFDVSINKLMKGKRIETD